MSWEEDPCLGPRVYSSLEVDDFGEREGHALDVGVTES